MEQSREEVSGASRRTRRIRHRGRSSQVFIYLGKQLRFFINESDWKVLPMAAIIAALVGMVIRRRFFINMEGSVIGAFALTCVAIWNGCFNSIQAVCRERPIIKREHRSGMHITSYVAAHMIYQFLLCLAQTGLTMYVLILMGVKIPAKGFMTPMMVIDIGITMLLITYASDMMSLFLSSISHTTTGAMTIMPFVLIFQLIFSGGIIPLPAWSQALSNFTISNYGIQAIAAQSGYNELPMVTAWNTLDGMRDNVVGGEVTLGQIMGVLDSKAVQDRRDLVLIDSTWLDETVLQESGETAEQPATGNATGETAEQPVIEKATEETEEQPATENAVVETAEQVATENAAGETAEQAATGNATGETAEQVATENATGETEKQQEAPSVVPTEVGTPEPILTVGQVVDVLKEMPVLQENRDRVFTLKMKISDVFDMFGEEKVKELVQRKTAEASFKPEYVKSRINIVRNWIVLGGFALFFALISVIALEFIDKDKR